MTQHAPRRRQRAHGFARGAGAALLGRRPLSWRPRLYTHTVTAPVRWRTPEIACGPRAARNPPPYQQQPPLQRKVGAGEVGPRASPLFSFLEQTTHKHAQLGSSRLSLIAALRRRPLGASSSLPRSRTATRCHSARHSASPGAARTHTLQTTPWCHIARQRRPPSRLCLCLFPCRFSSCSRLALAPTALSRLPG